MRNPTVQDQAKARLLLREKKQREELRLAYDWFGDECPCGVGLGECREHPRARPAQRPPGSYRSSNGSGDWRVWLIDAGRGFGKSFSAAKFVTEEVMSGRAGWVALINGTTKDVRDVQIEHPDSGLIAVAPPWFKPLYEPSKSRITWPNGAIATMYTAEEPEALRGPQFDLAWCDELAKWKRTQQQMTWDMLMMCLRRKGERPTRVVVTSTPRPTATYKSIKEGPRTARTTGSTFDNAAHLDADFLDDMRTKYEGTRQGRQELNAEMLEDTPGALWLLAYLDDNRVDRVPPGVDLVRVVVTIDPSAGAAQDPEAKGAEAGIMVQARGSDGHEYLLEDLSVKGPPEQWGRIAAAAYREHRADAVCAEINNGGDMVEYVIRSIDDSINFKKLWASRGKATRAEPVASLYSQGKVHHVGAFPELESQLTTWVPGEKSPDRLDAKVWGTTELLLDAAAPSSGYAVGVPRSRLY